MQVLLRRTFAAVAPLVLALAGSAARATAQVADHAQSHTDRFGIKAPRVLDGEPPAAAAAPAPCDGHAVSTPPIQVGTGGNPEPDTAPARLADGGSSAMATGAFTYFGNGIVQPTGARRTVSAAVSPCVINVRDTVLQTGNWYAALSRDSGMSWTDLDPATFFAPVDGGFCCNQRVEYVSSHDLAVWLLQYSYSPINQRGSFQIAVANGRDELRSGRASDWTLYRFDPTDFGFGLGHWLDFADLGFNDDWLYVSANVYSGSTLAGAVVWRISLLDLQQNQSVTFSYLDDSTLGGHSYRFATRAGDGTNMYWATLMSTTSLRVWRQNTIGIVRSRVDVTTAAWQSTGSDLCDGPDGRGWLGNAVGRIRGACGTASELIFAWTSYGNGGSRPRPYTRITRLRESDRSLLAEHDVYSPGDCWAYAAIDSNTLGHVGGVFAIGGPNRHVRSSAFLVDAYTSWSGVIAYNMAPSTNNPPGERFGDFFGVRRDWLDPRTFVAAGHLMNGGDQAGDVEPHHVWFGRDEYTPDWVNLAVDSSPAPGAAIAIDVTDRTGDRSGTAPFTRVYAPRQGYVLNAEAEYQSGPRTYRFSHWVHNGIPGPAGERSLAVGDIGTVDDSVLAQYFAVRSIGFELSSHVTAPVTIGISPLDLDGRSNGTPLFVRRYTEGTLVRMTLPVASLGGHPFRRWRVNGLVYPEGQLSVDYVLGAGDARAVAEFYEYTPGRFVPFGSGCAGSNALDVHDGLGTPDVAAAIEWRVRGGVPGMPAALFLGASNTLWLGQALPVFLPDAPGCPILVSVDITVGLSTDALGTASLSLLVPADPALFGGHVFTQFGGVDPGANTLGMSFSNGLDARIGGLR